MTKFVKSLVLGGMLAFSVGLAGTAFAATPMLAVTQNGSTMTLTVNNADPYATVNLYQRQTTQLWTVVNNFGQTNANGYFNVNQGLGFDGTNNPMEFYVVVNGQQSAVVQLYPNGNGSCTYNCGNPSSVMVSQNSVSLNVGQSTTITAYAANGSGIYLSGNSNLGIASDTLSGNQVTITGNSTGSTTLTICAYNNYQCASVYITVNSGGYTGGLTFSPSNPTVTVGQNMMVSISASNYNYGQSYTITNNTNSSVASAYISGQSVYINSLANGSSTITVCQNNSSVCGTIFVTVSGNNYNNGITFSQNNITLTFGQTSNVTFYSNNNNSGSYYISNPNNNVVNSYISGNTLYLTALNTAGSAAITVCQNNGGTCGTLNVTVNTNGNYGSNVVNLYDNYYSPSSITVNPGTTVTFTNRGSMNHTVTADDNSFNSGNLAPGASYAYTFNATGTFRYHCTYHGSSGGVGMSGIVTVSGGSTGNISFSPSSVSVTAGQTQQVTINNNYNYGGNYYTINNNSNTGAASAYISGSVLTVAGINNGTSTLTVCQTGNINCGTLFVTVSGNGNSGSVLGANTYANGQLISQNGTVYLVYKNLKTGFASAAAFKGLGFSFSNVRTSYDYTLTNSGYIVTTANSGHPWGTWIKSGSTVYFVHQSGLIPVGDYSTFLNNGGQDAWVVAANIWDFQLPILPIMTINDARLR